MTRIRLKFLFRQVKSLLLCLWPSMALVFPLEATCYVEPNVGQPAIVIQGKVTSSDVPLAGVTVSVRSAAVTTTTDADGYYTLRVPFSPATLVFSFVGYQRYETVVTGSGTVDVALQVDSERLDEVVVVGYGTQRRASLTGSVASVSGSEIVTTKNENVQNMLTGKLPGVRVTQKSSEPGSFNNTFDIRGLGAPLIIIDGVPRDNITRLDPNEIESISVLKDASAAIYGVRAANGVVLVTTKQGKSGSMSIGYSVNAGFQEAIGLPVTVDAIQQMTLMNEKTMTNFVSPYMQYTDADFEPYRTGELSSADWMGAALRDFAPSAQHNLNVNGGTDKLNYFFNFGYLDQGGLWKSGDLNYERYNLRANVGTAITDRLRSELRISGITDRKRQPYAATEEVFKSLWRQSALSPVYANDNPAYPGNAYDAAHTVVMTTSDKSGYRNYASNIFQSSLSLTYDVPGVEGLSARALYSFDYSSNTDKAYRKEYALYGYDSQTEVYTPNLANSPSRVRRAFYEKKSTLLQLSLNYQRQFAEKHNVSGLLLYEEGTLIGDNFYAMRELSLPVDQLFAGNVTNQEGNMDQGDLYEFANKGLIGRVNYDFAARYLTEFSFRYDGSSKFMKGARWGFFPAASIGWRLSEEPFFKRAAALSFVNDFKLRASYGRLGDDSGANFQFVSGYDYPASGYIFNGNFINGVGFRSAPNYNLTWYTATTSNAGVDLILWDGKLGVTADIFQRDREGLLGYQVLTIPGIVGADLPQENLNSDRHRGYEISLSHRNRVNDFAYNISANIAYTYSMTRDYARSTLGNSYSNWRNNNVNRYNEIWWGVESTGVFTSYDEIYNSTVNYGNGNMEHLPGDYIYEDWNGDGVIDGNDDHPIATRNNSPRVNGGLTFAAEYRGIDMSLLLQGAAMSYVEYPEQLSTPFVWQNGNILSMFLDRWHPEDPEADRYDPNTKWVAGSRPALGRPIGTGTAVVRDASYLRVKSMEIGYSLPKQWLNKLTIAGMRVYVNAYNLLTFTGIKYLDPEHPSDSYGYLYPINRTYNVGILINL